MQNKTSVDPAAVEALRDSNLKNIDRCRTLVEQTFRSRIPNPTERNTYNDLMAQLDKLDDEVLDAPAGDLPKITDVVMAYILEFSDVCADITGDHSAKTHIQALRDKHGVVEIGGRDRARLTGQNLH